MDEIDNFSSQIFEEAKRFLERAREADKLSNPQGRDAYLHAALILAFSALEAHVNAIADEKSMTKGLTLQEKGLLREKIIEFKDGKFVLTERLQIFRLEDRIQFLFSRFSDSGLDKHSAWWSRLKEANLLRNDLTHPKKVAIIDISAVECAMLSVLDCLNAVYGAVYKSQFPAYGRKLDSNLIF